MFSFICCSDYFLAFLLLIYIYTGNLRGITLKVMGHFKVDLIIDLPLPLGFMFSDIFLGIIIFTSG